LTVNDTLANSARAAHDVGLAAWLGGAMFGKLALNPSLKKITNPTERGSVLNAAWNGYNPINALGLGAAALSWGAARLTETHPENLSGSEHLLSQAKDGLMAVAVLTGVASGVQGVRLAKQAPDGAVPVQSGTEPDQDTPAKAASIQRSLGVLANVNILTGIALVAVNGVLAQINYSHPPTGRALTRSSAVSGTAVSPLWAIPALGLAAAGADQIRRTN
jgi:hypothetical protein